jgi:hypothetical protein
MNKTGSAQLTLVRIPHSYGKKRTISEGIDKNDATFIVRKLYHGRFGFFRFFVSVQKRTALRLDFPYSLNRRDKSISISAS